jgi:hypothetical protein
MLFMGPESWLKVCLPAFPLGFALIGIGGYWRENPVPLLPPTIAFWGLGVLYYLFTHLYVPNRRYPLVLMIGASILWLVASITSHNLSKFMVSPAYSGPLSVLRNTDFLFAYISAGLGCAAGLINFFKYEPLILAKVQEEKGRLSIEE